MSYLSLARKYRPRRFDDMVGQESSTKALANAIKLGREPHSVIFTGVRGVGKTTIARIYAKALNCESGPTLDPCDVCESCSAIQAGNHEDVLEIDGASNTGVDDVRALQETLGYVPQRSKFKVYIIDEVHMLSTSAFNALLKTLEEPPSHIVFVFATTELHKVPETIQSRCQTFHLQKISRQVILNRLTFILDSEEIPYDIEALSLIAKEGRGSLRDALTTLDQAIALGGGSVQSKNIHSILGHSHQHAVHDLLVALLSRDAEKVIGNIAQWDQEGNSFSSLCEGLARSCRNAMIMRDLKNESLDIQILDLEDKERSTIAEIAQNAHPLDLNRLFRTWIKCLDDLRNADLDRYVVENYALEWCLDPGLPDLTSMMGMLSGAIAPQHGFDSPKSNQSQGRPAAVQLGLKDRWKQQKGPEVAPAVSASQNAMPHAETAPVKHESLTLKKSTQQEDLHQKLKASVPDHELTHPNQHVQSIVSPKQDIPAIEHKETSNLQAPEIEKTDVKVNLEPAKVLSRGTKIGEPELPVAVEGPAPVPSESSDAQPFPDSWRALVDEWKKLKPLQARVLEETYVIHYSTEKIVIAVDPGTMAGAKLLQSEARKKVQQQLAQMFGFLGFFDIQAKNPQEASTENSIGENDAKPLGESLLEVKQREREVAKDKLKKQIQEHPLTMELISKFGGTIESIEFP